MKVRYESMSYVRVDWDNGDYEYFKNDTECFDGFRSAFLLHSNYRYKRIRRLEELPSDKKCTRYKRHNKQSQDFERITEND